MSLSAATRTEIETVRDRYPHPRSGDSARALGSAARGGPPGAGGDGRGRRHSCSVTPSEVEAVSTFYSMYFQKPHGKHEVLVCINVSCALRGADDIVATSGTQPRLQVRRDHRGRRVHLEQHC